MVTTLLVIHLIIAIALVAVVLLQRSEGGALGIGGGGGGGGMSGFLTGRSTANLLTRTTAILAALFILTSLTLAKLSGGGKSGSIFDQPPAAESTAPAPGGSDAPPPAETPAAPQTPSAPLAR